VRPEDYWIGLGENVIGLDVLRDGNEARQFSTYMVIVNVILDKRFRSVMDIGCNYGVLAVFLSRSAWQGDYVGIDNNPYAIHHVLSRHESYYVGVGNLRKLSTGSKAFDCVVIKDVIEHLESIEPLREAFRVSSNYVIIATYLPWHDAPSVIQQHPDGYYTNTYNRAEVLALGRECGFECTETLRVNETNGTPNEVTLWRRV